MSDMLDISKKNYLNLVLDDDPLFSPQSALKVPGQGRLNRSASFFSPHSPPASLSHDLSTEHVSKENSSGALWSSNIWSQAPISKPKQAFRPDRSMSLTESSSSLISSFGQLKNLDAFLLGAATTVAPPPGFPPSSALPAQVPPGLSCNRYKTELCRGFQETGSCKYGNKCQFAHGEAELRGMFRHPKYKTEPCRTFYNFGYCPYGSRCHFIHEEKTSSSLLPPAKVQNQLSPSSGQSLRHQLRQSVSFAGFVGSSRSSPPPSFPSSFSDANPGFSRAPSVSPPPAERSPVFFDTQQWDAASFQFGSNQTPASAGDLPNIPLILEPKASRCVCGHGKGFGRVYSSLEEDDHAQDSVLLSRPLGSGAFMKRVSSEESLEDYSSSGGSSSGSDSPTFDGPGTKRLTVFERLSLSD